MRQDFIFRNAYAWASEAANVCTSNNPALKSYAEDIAGEVVEDIWRKYLKDNDLSVFKAESKGLYYTIAKCKCIKMMRRIYPYIGKHVSSDCEVVKASYGRSRTVYESNFDKGTEHDYSSASVDCRHGNYDTEFISSCIDRLSPLSQEIVNLHTAGYSQKEISEIVGKEYGAVRVALTRARNSLKEMMREAV